MHGQFVPARGELRRSVVAQYPDRWVGPTSAVYSATKHAVRVLSEGLRQEVSPTIRVTVVAPGATESELSTTISDPALKQATVEQFRVHLLPAEAIARPIVYGLCRGAARRRRRE